MASNVFRVFSFVFACFCVWPASFAQESDGCLCVLFHLCVNGTLVRDGGIGLEERSSFSGLPPNTCEGEGFVCCSLGGVEESGPLIQSPPSLPLNNGPSRGGNVPEGQGSSTTDAPIDVSDKPEAIADPVFNPNPGSCGVKRVSLVHRVSHVSLRESVTKYAEFPWMLAILVETAPGMPYVFHCGASLIHNQVALTAAHCVDRVKKTAMWVRAGEWNTENTEEPLPHQDRKVSHVEFHPQYAHSGLKHDIALLFFNYPLDIKDNVDLICLPNPNSILPRMRCTTTGWGRDPVDPNITHYAILHKVDLPIIPRAECQERLRKSPRVGPFFNLHPSSLCAGGEPKKDSCKGDGGGPLVCAVGEEEDESKQIWFQAGIVSWGIRCGTTNPGVYTDVSVHMEWINQKLTDFERSFSSLHPADLLYSNFQN